MCAMNSENSTAAREIGNQPASPFTQQSEQNISSKVLNGMLESPQLQRAAAAQWRQCAPSHCADESSMAAASGRFNLTMRPMPHVHFIFKTHHGQQTKQKQSKRGRRATAQGSSTHRRLGSVLRVLALVSSRLEAAAGRFPELLHALLRGQSIHRDEKSGLL